MTQKLAIANCRVSTAEQIKNNSLNRQEQAVLKAARELDVVIPDGYWWKGSVSSKRGTNLYRKDIIEMIDKCKKDKRIKYLIVDEPDRFMRSIDEAAFFEVTFKQLGVTVWYASDSELNKGDLASKLLKFTKYLSAEGSNEERQRKSINGQSTALKEGRYPFVPKPGYRRGYEKGVPEIDEVRGPILQKILLRILQFEVNPSQALVELNKTDFVKGRVLYKMDKFRKIITDPFYAGIVEVNKQVNVRNENGLHRPLITKDQHLELVRIMDGRPKNQAGPRKNGNPKYPLSNLVDHAECADKRYGRVVGLDLNNGQNKEKIYEKYRCRACRKSIPSDVVHAQLGDHLKSVKVTEQGEKDILDAFRKVWKENESQKENDIHRLRYQLKKLNENIENKVEAATDPENIFIKSDILDSIQKKKKEITSLENELHEIETEEDFDKERFLVFAYGYVNGLNEQFLDLEFPQEERKLCKQILFPGGITIDSNKNVYTPEISPLIRLATNKKDPSKLEKSSMVRVKRL